MSTPEKHPIVIDIGTYCIRTGFGGDSEPIHVFPTVVGKPPNTQFRQTSNSSQNIFIGESAYKNATQLVLSNPMENRIIKNLDDTQILLDFIFSSKYKVPTNKTPLVLSISPFSTEKDRENLSTLIFETFRIPLFYPGLSSSLLLYASGLTTGIAIDAGETDINIVPVYESFSMMNLAKKLEIGGKTISESIRQNLIKPGSTLSLSSERSTLHYIKEHFCYIRFDNENPEENDTKKPEPKFFVTPDNQKYELNDQVCKIPEMIFKPDFITVDSLGLSQLTLQTIETIDTDIKNTVQNNIVISGGTSLIKGFHQKLEKDISEKIQSINVIAPPSRKIAPWVGGSMIASIGTFKDLALSKEEYEETGPSVVHFKCY